MMGMMSMIRVLPDKEYEEFMTKKAALATNRSDEERQS
jgi:hypothetical protein